jgi:hypothetical protein
VRRGIVCYPWSREHGTMLSMVPEDCHLYALLQNAYVPMVRALYSNGQSACRCYSITIVVSHTTTQKVIYNGSRLLSDAVSEPLLMTTANNVGLSGAVLEPLLISIISINFLH